ncbi:urease accessory protein UreD [Phenylobacterium sp. J367]|nr:urease accessory protein UreD [Phenylobacterium sp. J367]
MTRTIDVTLAAGARFLAVEAVILGRQAMGESVRAGRLRDRWRVRRAGGLVFADDLRLEGAVAATAARAPLLAGARAFATLLLVAEDAGRFLEPARAALGELGGASVFDGKLVARVAAPDGLTLRRALIPTLEALRGGAPLPRVWRS